MSRPRRQPLTLRVVRVHDPDADAAFERVLDLLADAFTERAICEARADVAERLARPVEAVDREPGRLDDEDQRWLAQLDERGVA